MGKAKNMETKKESVSSKNIAIRKRRQGLLKKAREFAVLSESEVALITISPDGAIGKYASSSMQSIIAKFRRWFKFATKIQSPQVDSEELGEGIYGEVYNVDKLRAEAEEPLLIRDDADIHRLNHNDLGIAIFDDLDSLTVDELDSLEDELNKGVLCIKDRKIQLMTEEVEHSRMQRQQLLQENQMLHRQVEELQDLGGSSLPSSRAASSILPITSPADSHSDSSTNSRLDLSLNLSLS